MKKISLILVLLSTSILIAQNEASNWFFGQGGGISFDPNTYAVSSVDGGQLTTREGCATISDSDGNLLFYTDGLVAYDRTHNVLQNGDGLYGHSSSSQSALIVPKPLDDNIYYIFTVGSRVGQSIDHGFSYSIVDMSMNGGLGAITVKNQNLLTNTSEKLSAVLKDCQDESIWVITYAAADGVGDINNTFYAFEVSDTGVNTTPVKSAVNTNGSARGYLKFSPDGTKLAAANMGNNLDDFQPAPRALYLYDFDTATGSVTNPMQLPIDSSNDAPYGVEFSPNSQLLYVHSSNDFFPPQGEPNSPIYHRSALTQFNLAAANIQSSGIIIDERMLYRGALQLGPDGKIYRALSQTYQLGLPYLGVIHNPNEVGVASNYQHNAINVSPNISTQGLPPFIQSFFNDKIDIIQNEVSTLDLSLCTGDTYILEYDDIPNAIYTWYKDGLLLAESDFDLVVAENGFYELTIELTSGNCDNLKGEATVTYFEIPVANPVEDLLFCDDDNDKVLSFDFNSTLDSVVLGTQDPLNNVVFYYSSEEDAVNKVKELTMPFTNTSSPQEIFYRIENTEYYGCYDIDSFTIEIFDTPYVEDVGVIEICDDDTDGDAMNGRVTTNLNDLNILALGIQDSLSFTVSYHTSQNDAENAVSALPNPYYNTTSTEEIFIRIENILNSDCYSTSSFQLIVNVVPEAIDVSLFQCDEDGVYDGFTLYNLTESHGSLTNGQIDRSTKYYLTSNDALNDANEINGNSFTNTSNPQTIYVRVIDNITGCYNFSELSLELSATSASDAALFLCDDDGIEDGMTEFDLSTIENDVILGISDDVEVNFYATNDDALLEVNKLNFLFTNTIPYNQTIYVRVENDNACYGINEVELTVYELPNLKDDEDLIYCLNYYPETLILTAGIDGDDPNNYQFEWSTGETSYSIEINEVRDYIVTATNANNCSKSRTIRVSPSNIATFGNINVVDATSNNTITVNVSGEGDYEYALNEILGPYQDSNFFENVPPGLHTVYVRDKNECGIVDTIVSVIGFPKFFTPNNDSYHDTWHVYGIDDPDHYESKVYIFDRYGKLIKELLPSGPGWDGTFNGNPMPTNDYWFYVNLQDGRQFRSHFTLKR